MGGLLPLNVLLVDYILFMKNKGKIMSKPNMFTKPTYICHYIFSYFGKENAATYAIYFPQMQPSLRVAYVSGHKKVRIQTDMSKKEKHNRQHQRGEILKKEQFF